MTISEEPTWTAEIVCRGYGQTFVAYLSDQTGRARGLHGPGSVSQGAVLEALGRITRQSREGGGRIETLYGAGRVAVRALRA